MDGFDYSYRNTGANTYMIMDMQFGSGGKGLLAGYLALHKKPDTVITAWGPNAGHTFIDSSGRKFVHRMLANGIVSPNLRRVLIGPGSVIDLNILGREIKECKDLLIGKEIWIHPSAIILHPNHVLDDKDRKSIGSTMKGTGAAIIDRIERKVGHDVIADQAMPITWLDNIAQMGITIGVSAQHYDRAIAQSHVIQIEGAQGYSLSLYHGFYPYTTSRDVTPAQVMADCALPLGLDPVVYGVVRTYPIRVANRHDENGVLVGTSGPHYSDQEELQWSDIGVEPEMTTVTKLERRVFTFSEEQYYEASWRMQPSRIFLNFANYMGRDAIDKLINTIENGPCGEIVDWVGVGPTNRDVYKRTVYENIFQGKL